MAENSFKQLNQVLITIGSYKIAVYVDASGNQNECQCL